MLIRFEITIDDAVAEFIELARNYLAAAN